MNHTITAAELAQLREALKYAESKLEMGWPFPVPKVKTALTLLSEIAARTSEPCGWLESREGRVKWNPNVGVKLGAALYLAPQPAAVPDGMVLVPVEPTHEMWIAWANGKSFSESYKAMIAAAPKEAT